MKKNPDIISNKSDIIRALGGTPRLRIPAAIRTKIMHQAILGITAAVKHNSKDSTYPRELGKISVSSLNKIKVQEVQKFIEMFLDIVSEKILENAQIEISYTDLNELQNLTTLYNTFIYHLADSEYKTFMPVNKPEVLAIGFFKH